MKPFVKTVNGRYLLTAEIFDGVLYISMLYIYTYNKYVSSIYYIYYAHTHIYIYIYVIYVIYIYI